MVGEARFLKETTFYARHGELWGSGEFIASLAVDIACNHAAGDAIGDVIEPLIAAAARDEGYRVLPSQQEPVVMNTKGPSDPPSRLSIRRRLK